ncbi:acylphosphatase [Pseudodesulfovibrio sp. F-1]|uniref:acylphosphatase n=1 Tax=Pseudodesulfovibrio alkaliphilus TaxID=2661613 RepID=A0A7K1KKJ5_9BACT|nr:acylphosphatase [Pseudodesulfovibrio alkaliphilus]MUM76595.1 acylphosphatase [Pseudodesulfovibrio alkaliphilus]
MNEAHSIIHGKVQGVWFRAWAADMARELGLTGWMRNLPDGGVETLAQGEKAPLERFVERLLDGPPLARVTQVETDWREPDKRFDRFSVTG